MKRFRIIINGDVQGISFRYYAKKEAQSLGVKGWVRNTSDGNVEIVVEGKREKLKEFVTWCKKGPTFAKVKNVKVVEEEYKNEFEDFFIKYGF